VVTSLLFSAKTGSALTGIEAGRTPLLWSGPKRGAGNCGPPDVAEPPGGRVSENARTHEQALGCWATRCFGMPVTSLVRMRG
jgi:hypothetical protein